MLRKKYAAACLDWLDSRWPRESVVWKKKQTEMSPQEKMEWRNDSDDPCRGRMDVSSFVPLFVQAPRGEQAPPQNKTARYGTAAAGGPEDFSHGAGAAEEDRDVRHVASQYRVMNETSRSLHVAVPEGCSARIGLGTSTEKGDSGRQPESSKGSSLVQQDEPLDPKKVGRVSPIKMTEVAQETNPETLWSSAGRRTSPEETGTRVMCREVSSGELTPDTPDTPCRSLSSASLLPGEGKLLIGTAEKRNFRGLNCFSLLNKMRLPTGPRNSGCHSLPFLEIAKQKTDSAITEQHPIVEPEGIRRISAVSSHPCPDLPSSFSEPIPCGLNKHLLLFIYTVYAFLTGCTYFGWPALSHMLFKAGAYSWRCSPTSTPPSASSSSSLDPAEKVSSASESRSSPKPYLCDEQDAAVAPLFTVAHVSECLMCIVAGVLIDTISPKLVAVIGQALNALGWILLACSSESFPVYVPAMVCIGCGADTGYLPLLRIASLFPGHSATVITILGAANTASFAIPVLLEAMWRAAGPSWSFSHVCLVYLCAGPIFCGTLGLCFVPWKPFGFERNNVSAVACRSSPPDPTPRRRILSSSLTIFLSFLCRHNPLLKGGTKRGGSWAGSSGTTRGGRDVESGKEDQTEEMAGSSFKGGHIECGTVCGGIMEHGWTGSDMCEDASQKDAEFTHVRRQGTDYSRRKKSMECGFHSRETAPGRGDTANSDTDTCTIVEEGKDMEHLGRKAEERHVPETPPLPPTFVSQLCSPHFFCVAVYSSLSSVAMSFLQSASSRVYSESALDAMDLALSLSFLPCVFLGKMIDLFGPFPVLLFMNTMGIMSVVCAVGSAQLAVHVVSVVAFCIYVSIDCEQVFCYVECTFRPEHFGKLSGLFHANDGIIALIAIPLYDQVTVKLLGGNPLPVFWTLAGALFAVYGVLGALWFIRIRNPDPFGVLAEKEKQRECRTKAAASLVHVFTNRTEDELPEEFKDQEGQLGDPSLCFSETSNEQRVPLSQATNAGGERHGGSQESSNSVGVEAGRTVSGSSSVLDRVGSRPVLTETTQHSREGDQRMPAAAFLRHSLPDNLRMKGGTSDHGGCKQEPHSVCPACTSSAGQDHAGVTLECTSCGVGAADSSGHDDCVRRLRAGGCASVSVLSYGRSTSAEVDMNAVHCFSGVHSSGVSGLILSPRCCRPVPALSETEVALETGGGLNGGDADAAGVPPYMRIDSLPSVLVGTECACGGGSGGLGLCGGRAQVPSTPFSLPKYVLVCIYMLYAFLTGCVYFGWPSLSFMMFRSGAYSWLCEQEETTGVSGGSGGSTEGSGTTSREDSSPAGTSALGSDGDAKHYLCDEQDAAVSPLFTICYVTQSLMSVVAGTLLDHVSPKKAAMLGQTFNGIGWTLLAHSSRQFPAYIPAMVFIGLGADTAYLPTLLIATLFPGKRATVITLLGAANTSSFAVPLILETIWTRLAPQWAFSDVCFLYLCVGPIFCFILAALFIPYTAYGKTSSPSACPQRGGLLSPGGGVLKRIKNGLNRRRNRVGVDMCSDPTKERKASQGFEAEVLTTKPRGTCRGGIRASLRSLINVCSLLTSGLSKGRKGKGTACLSGTDGGITPSDGGGGCRGCDQCLPLKTIDLEGDGTRAGGGVSVDQRRHSAGGSQAIQLSRGSAEEIIAASNGDIVLDCPTSSGNTLHEGSTTPECILDNTMCQQLSARRGWLSLPWLSRSEAAEQKKVRLSWTTQGGRNILKTSEGELMNTGQCMKKTNAAEEREHATRCGACGGVGTRQSASLCPCEPGDAATGLHLDDKEYVEQSAIDQNASQHLKDTGGEEIIVVKEDQKKKCSVLSSECCCHNFASEGGGADATAGGGICRCEGGPQDGSRGREGGHVRVDDGEATEILELERCYPGREFAEKKRRLIGTKADKRRRRNGGDIHGLEPGTRRSSLAREAEPSFWSQTCSSHFVCITLYWSCQAIATSFLQSAANRLFSTTVVDFMDVALSFSFVPCVLLGKTIDVFGPFPVLVLVNTAGVLAYVFAIVGDPMNRALNALRYVAVMCFCVYIAVDSEQVFCYVQNTFSPKHFGKLSGLALTLGGVISFVSIPLYDSVTIRTLKGNAFPVALGISFVLAVVYVMLGVMWFVRSRNPQPFNVLPVALAAAAPSSHDSFFSGDEPRQRCPGQTQECAAPPTVGCVSDGDDSRNPRVQAKRSLEGFEV
ncbi:major facilitator family protein [Cystoisospora suis]|uniref:Major facilitator family protein n=1 Tax=Cystoisospora suis TaxID=483139 RepID=A0A2C6KV40_9APIC|nr:major facilitator family protein [Cystoisospora suis]